jgi:D-3-phosphoglycerate dehydrogenase
VDLVWLFGSSRVVRAGNLHLLPRCGAILRTGSGIENVPVEAASERGIVVANTPEVAIDAVSDHAIGLLFAGLSQIAVQDRAVRAGVYTRSHAERGNASLAALRPEAAGTVIASVLFSRRRAAKTAFPRSAWERGASSQNSQQCLGHSDLCNPRRIA